MVSVRILASEISVFHVCTTNGLLVSKFLALLCMANLFQQVWGGVDNLVNLTREIFQIRGDLEPIGGVRQNLSIACIYELKKN